MLGINDYLDIDGYEHVLAAKRAGRLGNIELILPVIELRLDAFSGTDTDWKRINYHVLFSDQLDAVDIRTHFLNRLAVNHPLWGGVITKRTLAEFGQRVLEQIPPNKRNNNLTPEELGFNNLTFPLADLQRILGNTTAFTNRYLTAVGKAEWSNLRWEKAIADKRTLIDSVDFLFTAAASPEACRQSQAKLRTEAVTIPLIDCSDAHHPSSSTEKDRLGHCYAWMKADPTFAGLRQVLNDPEGRVYLGDKPQKLAVVEQHPTKFLTSVSISKRDGSSLSEQWFDNTIELTPDFVAIIGNKGMGKSALTDILALTGHSDAPPTSYAFLDANHFRDHEGKAAHFTAKAMWHGGPPTTMGLADAVPAAAIPRVRYIPQHYFEDLCNELLDTSGLQVELQKVIYSHLDETETLGHLTLQDLISDRTAEADRDIAALRARLAGANRKLIGLERATTVKELSRLDNQLALAEDELAAHDAAKPVPVEQPPAATTTPDLDAALQERQIAEISLDHLKSQLAGHRALRASVLDLETRLFAFSESAVQLRDETRETFEALGLNIDDVIEVAIDFSQVATLRQSLEETIAELSAQHAGGEARLSQSHARIAQLTDALDAPQRAYQRYLEEQSAWEARRAGLVDTIAGLGRRRTELLTSTREEIGRLRQERGELSAQIHERQLSKAAFQRALYARLVERLEAEPIVAKALPFEFDARLVDRRLVDIFNEMINHTSRGAFGDTDVIRQRLATTDINDATSLGRTLQQVVEELFDGKDIDNLERQLKKAYYAESVYGLLFGLEYLEVRYSIRVKGRELSQLTPGERGSVLLVFYLIADNDDRPLIIDQPEENLDNQSLYELVVPCLMDAKKRRQIIMVTHNPNLAVVCDAEQIIWCHIDKELGNRVTYKTGSLENPEMNHHVVDVLEGTWPAFKTRSRRYQEQVGRSR